MIWRRTILVLVLAGCYLNIAAAQDMPTLESIADAIQKQDDQWHDLTVKYRCSIKVLDTPTKVSLFDLTWSVTRDGRERVTRLSPGSLGPKSVKREEAAFNGDIYMTFDSQSTGSGSVGHQVTSFLNQSLSPKRFGLYITGHEIGLPLTVGQWIRLEKSNCAIIASDENTITIEGDDPMADGMRLKAVLDRRFGWRPVQIDLSNSGGLLTVLKDLKYRELKVNGATVWFPSKGLREGYNPSTHKPLSVVEYSLEDIELNRDPSRDEFVLTYPSGCLLLNTDTSETHYTTAETTVNDVPKFTGKLMTMQEHDRRLSGEGQPESSAQGNSRAIRWLGLVTTILIIVILTGVALRRRFAPKDLE